MEGEGGARTSMDGCVGTGDGEMGSSHSGKDGKQRMGGVLTLTLMQRKGVERMG